MSDDKTGVEINAIFQAEQASEIIKVELYRKVWNEAIEAAALEMEKHDYFNEYIHEIRKLKK